VVMNRHFYGAAHGVPVSKLECRSVSEDRRFRVEVRGTTHARIIDDQLMLSSVLTISQARGNAKLLRQFIDRSGPTVCYHLRSDNNARYGHVRRVPELVTNNPPPHYFASCSPSVRSCVVCMTDYCIDIGWHGRKKGWIIELVTYRQLGALRSPFDSNWSAGHDTRPEDAQRSLYQLRYGPGSLRHMWSKADEVLLEPEGEWVGEPLA
jgi:hypothetical protein